MKDDPKPFTVGYYPEPFMKSDYILSRYRSLPDALIGAGEYAKTYYGERSPIIVRQGKKKLVEIPTGAGRQ